MPNRFLNNIDSLEELPQKVKELLLNLIKNFEEIETDDGDFANEDNLSEAFCKLCKYFLKNDSFAYLFLLTHLEDDLHKIAGYDRNEALKYYGLIDDFNADLFKNRKIDYSKFCYTLQCFDIYFDAFKNQSSIPEELSMCIQLLDEMYWFNDYKYETLKCKIDRKIRLILNEYIHSYLSTFPDEYFDDEKYADSLEENLICDCTKADYKRFDSTLDYETYKELLDLLNSNKYIYLSCSFDKNLNGSTYYYRTSNNEVQIGDEVIVLVGNSNTKRHAWVVNKEYFTKNNLPLELERTKEILQKVEDDD